MAIQRKLYLKLFVIMLLVHKISAAAIADESTTSNSNSADPTNEPPSPPSSAASPKLDTGHPLIPAASVSADIAKLSPSMSTQKRQSQIIIR